MNILRHIPAVLSTVSHFGDDNPIEKETNGTNKCQHDFRFRIFVNQYYGTEYLNKNRNFDTKEIEN